jgi:hypothetical protein
MDEIQQSSKRTEVENPSMRLEAEPGQTLQEVWAYLTPTEARDLLEALTYWREAEEAGQHDPEWHTHVGGPGAELTIGVVWDAPPG